MQITPAYLAEYLIYVIGITVIIIMLLYHIFSQEKVALKRKKRKHEKTTRK